MNGQTVEELKNMLDDVDDSILPDEITRKLLAIMIITNTDSMCKLTAVVQDNHKEVMKLIKHLDDRGMSNMEWGEGAAEKLSGDIECIKKDRKRNPTMIEWIRKHPKKLTFGLVIAFLISNVWFISGIRYTVTFTVLNFLRFSPEFIDQVMNLLFT